MPIAQAFLFFGWNAVAFFVFTDLSCKMIAERFWNAFASARKDVILRKTKSRPGTTFRESK